MNECLFQRKNLGEMFERDEQEKKGGCFLFSVMSERLGRQKINMPTTCELSRNPVGARKAILQFPPCYLLPAAKDDQ